MTDLSRAIAVKPIITYPREAQVGKTYLMTIDLQPEENFEWQYDEEEYPIYCSVDTDLFSSKPVGEPVVVLHRFGGSYGEAKFLLTAFCRETTGEIRVTLVNKWGVLIKSLKLESISIIKYQGLTSDSSEIITELKTFQYDKSHRFQSFQQNHALLTTTAIMAIGGAEDKIHNRLILRTFFECSGGAEARIAIIPSASREPIIIGGRYRNLFEDMGAKSIEIIDIGEREQGADPNWLAYLNSCTGVFITGGDQLRLCGLLADTPILERIRIRTQLGEITLAATSAGLPVLGQYMIAGGGSGESPSHSLIDLATGLGIVPEVLFDQHFFNTNRMARLLSAIAIHPDKLGIGIDEDTCAVIESSQTFQVIGKGAVTVIDPSGISYTNSSSADISEPFSIHNLRVHILTNGHCYDIHRRLPVFANSKARSLEAVVSSPGFSTRRVQQSQQDLTSPAIMAIGGAEDKVHNRLILQTFLKRSGGSEARIAIIPSASREPIIIGGRYRNLFEDMGAKSIEIIDIGEREQGADPNWLAYLNSCTGVFITGGDQLRLCGLLADTPILERIRIRTQLGEITLAATSAGLPVLGQYMIAGGGSGESPSHSLIDLATGLGIVPEVIWDQHFHNRNRISRLINAVAAYPDKLGIGIDEDTCVILENANFFQVIGKGSVTVIDPTEVSYNNWNSITVNDPISIHNLHVHILAHGDRYDLHHRKAISSGNNQAQIEENSKKFEQLQSSPSNLDYLQRLTEVISSNESSIRSAIESELVNVLHRKEVESYEIPDDNNQATVEAVGEIQTFDLDVSGIEYFNNEKLVVPFKLQVECLLQYFIYKADYYSLDEDRSISIDDWNDHYFMAEEYYPLDVEGLVAVTPDLESVEFSELSDDDIMDLLTDADISIESLTRIEVISS